MEEHKYLAFLGKHWSKFLMGILALAIVGVWTERFFTANNTQSQQDFLVANQILERFRSGEPLASESIEAVTLILKRHPELHPKYDAMLAMTYFAQAHPNKGLPYAKATLEHVRKDLPLPYQNFADTSLLIAEKRYQEAYEEALTLHAQLKQGETLPTLQALNLLRLVSLENEVDATSTAWDELIAHPAYASITPLFQEGKLTLEDWHSLRLNN